jgi:hypothetical protein
LTTKHSLDLLSEEPGTPLAKSPEKSARQQYRPAEVTIIASDATVLGLA